MLKALLLPPGNLLLLAAVGGLVRLRWKRTGGWIVAVSIVLLALLATPACSGLLLRSLDAYPALTPDTLEADAQAIVVLSGDFESWASEYQGPSVGGMTLQRIRYGAWLYRATGLPLLVTGGVVRPGSPPVAEVMARTLRDEFGTPVRWVEDEARSTMDNARYSAAILRAADVERIYLVTNSFHIPRAKAAFEAAGLQVVPAPTGLVDSYEVDPGDLLPRPTGMLHSYLACHEWLGRLWYDLRYY